MVAWWRWLSKARGADSKYAQDKERLKHVRTGVVKSDLRQVVDVFTERAGPIIRDLQPGAYASLRQSQLDSAKTLIAYEKETFTMVCHVSVDFPVTVLTTVADPETLRKLQRWWKRIREARHQAALAKIRPILMTHLKKRVEACTRVQTTFRAWNMRRLVVCEQCSLKTKRGAATRCSRVCYHFMCFSCIRNFVKDSRHMKTPDPLQYVLSCTKPGCSERLPFTHAEQALPCELLNDYANRLREVFSMLLAVRMDKAEASINRMRVLNLVRSIRAAFPSNLRLSQPGDFLEITQQKNMETRDILFWSSQPGLQFSIFNVSGQELFSASLDSDSKGYVKRSIKSAVGRIVLREAWSDAFIGTIRVSRLPNKSLCVVSGLKDQDLELGKNIDEEVEAIAATILQNAARRFLYKCSRTCPVCLTDVRFPQFALNPDTDTCTHAQICWPCMVRYLWHEINRGVFIIGCPGECCRVQIDRYYVEHIIGKTGMERKRAMMKSLHESRILDLHKSKDQATWSNILQHHRVCPHCSALIFRYTGCSSMLCACGRRFNWDQSEVQVSTVLEKLQNQKSCASLVTKSQTQNFIF